MKENELIPFLHKFWNFDDNSVNFLMAIARKKDHPELTCSKEIVFREIVQQKKDIDRKVEKILTMAKNYKNYNFYVYANVNARFVINAWNNLQINMNKHFVECLTNLDIKHVFRKVDRLWLSELAKKDCCYKGFRKRFMLDIDTKDATKLELISNCLNEVTLPITTYNIETKNGRHHVCDAFNKQKFTDLLIKNKLDNICEVKTDSLVYLTHFDNRIKR